MSDPDHQQRPGPRQPPPMGQRGGHQPMSRGGHPHPQRFPGPHGRPARNFTDSGGVMHEPQSPDQLSWDNPFPSFPSGNRPNDGRNQTPQPQPQRRNSDPSQNAYEYGYGEGDAGQPQDQEPGWGHAEQHRGPPPNRRYPPLGPGMGPQPIRRTDSPASEYHQTPVSEYQQTPTSEVGSFHANLPMRGSGPGNHPPQQPSSHPSSYDKGFDDRGPPSRGPAHDSMHSNHSQPSLHSNREGVQSSYTDEPESYNEQASRNSQPEEDMPNFEAAGRGGSEEKALHIGSQAGRGGRGPVPPRKDVGGHHRPPQGGSQYSNSPQGIEGHDPYQGDYPGGPQPPRGGPDNGYQDQGYQNQGYQDQGYREQGYQDQGYHDQGYHDQGYPQYQQGGFDPSTGRGTPGPRPDFDFQFQGSPQDPSGFHPPPPGQYQGAGGPPPRMYGTPVGRGQYNGPPPRGRGGFGGPPHRGRGHYNGPPPQGRGQYGGPPPPQGYDQRDPHQQQGPPPNRNYNPNALPEHPAPVRPGLWQGSQGSNNNSNMGPPPVRQQPPPSEINIASASRPTPGNQGKAGAEPPVTNAELQRLRGLVQSNPSDQANSLLLAKKLQEAATVLAGEGDGKHRNKNRDKYLSDALRLTKKLVGYSYPDAMFFLADSYGKGGLGLQSDPKEAFNLYQSAAKIGHAPSAYRVAVCCELGQDEGGGTRRDPLKAVQWYKRAATLGDTPAMYKMGIIMLKGLLGQQRNPREAITWLKRAAERADEENPHALHELGLLYETASGNDSIIRDEAYARDLFMHAATLGYKFSQYRIGTCYEYGTLGFPVDPRMSIAWYSKAAVQEEHQSELALSGWYLTGSEGVIQQNDTEAYLWARKAAQAGLAKAEYAMGYFTEVGIGAPADLEAAKRWYWRAASQNFPKARDRLEDLRKGGARMAKERVSRSAVHKEGDCVVM